MGALEERSVGHMIEIQPLERMMSWTREASALRSELDPHEQDASSEQTGGGSAETGEKV